MTPLLAACIAYAGPQTVQTKSGPWLVRAVTVREGTGPPNISFQVAWKPNGSAYAVSCYELNDRPNLTYSLHFKGAPTRFTDLRAYDVVPNDYWQEKTGEWHKQFPTNVFIGKAVEHGRPTTYAWVCLESDDQGNTFKPRQVLKIFGADTRHLNGLEHGQPGEGSYLIEQAPAAWIPPADRPPKTTPTTPLRRKWKWINDLTPPKFTPTPWQRAN